MDPWLEKHWGDVHQAMVTYARDAIQPQLPDDLVARTEERVFLETPFGQGRQHEPDVRIIEAKTREKVRMPSSGVAVAEPLIMQFPNDPVTEGYIQILDLGSAKRVVTVIEVVSPANKSGGPGQRLYLQKQEEVLESETSLVEIDLLRGGNDVIVARRIGLPPTHRTQYQVSVRRGWRSDAVEVYRVPLRERLPIIRVPLRESDQDAHLDLQEIFDKAYENGRYDHTDYSMKAQPPLDAADAQWAETILREKGLPRPA